MQQHSQSYMCPQAGYAVKGHYPIAQSTAAATSTPWESWIHLICVLLHPEGSQELFALSLSIAHVYINVHGVCIYLHSTGAKGMVYIEKAHTEHVIYRLDRERVR